MKCKRSPILHIRNALMGACVLALGRPHGAAAATHTLRASPPSLDGTPLAMIMTLLALAMIAMGLIALLNKRHWH